MWKFDICSCSITTRTIRLLYHKMRIVVKYGLLWTQSFFWLDSASWSKLYWYYRLCRPIALRILRKIHIWALVRCGWLSCKFWRFLNKCTLNFSSSSRTIRTHMFSRMIFFFIKNYEIYCFLFWFFTNILNLIYFRMRFFLRHNIKLKKSFMF
jgi:hypothetical protein